MSRGKRREVIFYEDRICKRSVNCETHMCITCYGDCPCLECGENVCQMDDKTNRCMK